MSDFDLNEVRVLGVEEEKEDRYSRVRLAGWKSDILQNTHVFVAGAGALGNEVVKNLALLGVGHILLADFDRIEITNLSRSVLFRETDIGASKAQIAAERARALNPEIEVNWFEGDIETELGTGLFRRMDIVFGCLDNRAARRAVNRQCWLANTPLIDGALHGLDGAVRIFVPDQGPCYECTLTEQDYQDLQSRFSCAGLQVRKSEYGIAPTTPTSASIIAALQVEKAVSWLHGAKVPVGQELVYSSVLNSLDTVRLKEKIDCLSHERAEPLVELAWASAARTTLGEILAEAQRQLGEAACVELDRDLVLRMTCPACGQVENSITPLHKVDAARLRCPNCRHERTYVTAYRIDQTTPALGLPLAQAGIPPGHILRARSGDVLVYLELSGDFLPAKGH
jgi:molybdopterin/thiamine biosynthesis adenylyltransferase